MLFHILCGVIIVVLIIIVIYQINSSFSVPKCSYNKRETNYNEQRHMKCMKTSGYGEDQGSDANNTLDLQSEWNAELERQKSIGNLQSDVNFTSDSVLQPNVTFSNEIYTNNDNSIVIPTYRVSSSETPHYSKWVDQSESSTGTGGSDSDDHNREHPGQYEHDKKVLDKSGGENLDFDEKHNKDTITAADIENYITTYEKLKQGTIGDSVGATAVENVDTMVDFNNKTETDPTAYNDNIQYNLLASPDENNFETITAKDMYNKSEFPVLLDKSFHTSDKVVYLDDNSQIVAHTANISINEKENIDPANTDGTVYYPFQDDRNSENLLSMIRESINNRANDTSPTFLENSMLDQTEFFIK